jgi:hypothetical protein
MKRVVGALNPKIDGFEASCFDGRLHHRRHQPRADFAAWRRSAGCSPTTTRAQPARAWRCRAHRRIMSIPRSRPAGRRAARHPGRARGPAAVAWGENSEALFLTSCFVHPDAETAARASPTRKRPSSTAASPTPTSRSWSAAWRRWKAPTGCIGTAAAWRHPAAGDGPAEGRRPRGLLAERVRLDDQAAAGRVRQVRRRDQLRLARPTWRSGARRCGPTRSCCSPRRRPTR